MLCFPIATFSRQVWKDDDCLLFSESPKPFSRFGRKGTFFWKPMLKCSERITLMSNVAFNDSPGNPLSDSPYTDILCRKYSSRLNMYLYETYYWGDRLGCAPSVLIMDTLWRRTERLPIPLLAPSDSGGDWPKCSPDGFQLHSTCHTPY